jgi:hypothetical protein
MGKARIFPATSDNLESAYMAGGLYRMRMKIQRWNQNELALPKCD